MRSDKKPRVYGPFHRVNDPPEVVPGKPTWSATPERPGVMRDDDYAKIKVHVLRQTVILERGHA